MTSTLSIVCGLVVLSAAGVIIAVKPPPAPEPAPVVAPLRRSDGDDKSLASRQHTGRMVEVKGQVRRPGRCKWQTGLTLSAAIRQAGGASADASTLEAHVYRGAEVEQFYLDGEDAGHYVLQPNDLIEVTATTE